MTDKVFSLVLGKLEQAKLSELFERHDQLVAGLEDEPDRATIAELDQIQAEIDRRSRRRRKARRK